MANSKFGLAQLIACPVKLRGAPSGLMIKIKGELAQLASLPRRLTGSVPSRNSTGREGHRFVPHPCGTPQGPAMLLGLFLSIFLTFTYYIYLLFSQKTNRYYIGSTDDLARRGKHPNAGSTPSTKGGALDWEIRYTETVTDRATALKRELEIKKKKSRNYIEWLIQKTN